MANNCYRIPYILFPIPLKIYVHIWLGVFGFGEFASLAAALRILHPSSPSPIQLFHLGACACAYHMNVITHLSLFLFGRE